MRPAVAGEGCGGANRQQTGRKPGSSRVVLLFAHSLGVAQNPYLSIICRPGLAELCERLAPERLDAAVERGRSLEMTEAILFARHCADEIAGPMPVG